MGNYYKKIKHIYPTATDEDFKLERHGVDISLEYWNVIKLGPAPTLASLDAQVTDAEADISFLDSSKKAKFNQDTIKAVGLTMRDFMNQIAGGRTTEITKNELETKFLSYL